MKATLAILGLVATMSIQKAVLARPMHAGIDYERYLQEKDAVTNELDEWLAKYEDDGVANGWIPKSEARSADDVEEDRKQRFFLAKELLKKLEKQNPEATFTTDTPFTLLTEQEFATYVKNAYVGKASVSLRSADGGEDDDAVTGAKSEAPTVAESGASSNFLKNLSFDSFQELVREYFPGRDSRKLQQAADWSSSSCNAPVQNQGSCGSCWAFATVGAVETAQCLARGSNQRVVKYSEQQLTSCDRTNYGCQGGVPVYAFRYMQQNGLCRSDQYPYSSTSGRAPQCSTTCQKTAVGIKQVSRVSSSESALLSAISRQPIVVAVSAGNSVWKQYSGGVVASCPSAQVDHAVIAIGYDSSSIKIKNSWGARWGESGYIRLKRNTGGRGTCNVLSDMSYPQM